MADPQISQAIIEETSSQNYPTIARATRINRKPRQYADETDKEFERRKARELEIEKFRDYDKRLDGNGRVQPVFYDE